MTWACVFWPEAALKVWNNAATALFGWLAKLLLLFGPYRYGKFVASQLPRAVEVPPPFTALITSCPFWLLQKPMVAVSPEFTVCASLMVITQLVLELPTASV